MHSRSKSADCEETLISRVYRIGQMIVKRSLIRCTFNCSLVLLPSTRLSPSFHPFHGFNFQSFHSLLLERRFNPLELIASNEPDSFVPTLLRGDLHYRDYLKRSVQLIVIAKSNCFGKFVVFFQIRIYSKNTKTSNFSKFLQRLIKLILQNHRSSSNTRIANDGKRLSAFNYPGTLVSFQLR